MPDVASLTFQKRYDAVVTKTAPRPTTWDSFIGNSMAVETLREAIQVAEIEKRPVSHAILFGQPGVGKALSASTPIATPFGWVPIGALSIGDLVIAGDGTPAPVLGVFPQGRQPMYKIIFSDGAQIRATSDHLWAIETGSHRRNSVQSRARIGSGAHRLLSRRHIRSPTQWTIKDTAEIISALPTFGVSSKRWSIPLITNPVQIKEEPVPIHPYVLGVLLGDGSLSGKSCGFTTMDSEIVDSVRDNIPLGLFLRRHDQAGNAASTYGISSGPSGRGKQNNPILTAVRLLGINVTSHYKFVPQAYLWNSERVRLAVLQGLLDTDGTVEQSGSVTFASTSQQLIKDVVFLTQSLMGTTSITDRTVGQQVTVSLPNEVAPFRLSRKAKKVHPRTKYFPRRFIASIEPDGHDDAVCISIAHLSGLFVAEHHIVTHNTSLAKLVAQSTGGAFVETTATTLETPSDALRIFDELNAGWERTGKPSVLLLDEIHMLGMARGRSAIDQESMYPVLEDWTFFHNLLGKSIQYSDGETYTLTTSAYPIWPFTCIGATTDPGNLAAALLRRFILHVEMAPYTEADITNILLAFGDQLRWPITSTAAGELAKYTRLNPGQAYRLITMTRNRTIALGQQEITPDIVREVIARQRLYPMGLTETDIRILRTLDARPKGVGQAELARAVGISIGQFTNMIEPFLRQAGMVETLSRRMITAIGKAYLDRVASPTPT